MRIIPPTAATGSCFASTATIMSTPGCYKATAHDNEHTRTLQSHGYVAPQPGDSGQSRSTYKPFENLKALLGDEEPKDKD